MTNTNTVTLWNLANYGWACQASHTQGLTTVSTWTRDEVVLVLVILGEYEVQAAVLDGLPVPLSEIHERTTEDDRVDSAETLFERAAWHLAQTRDDRVGTELRATMEAMAKIMPPEVSSMIGGPQVPLRLGSALRLLALAVLSAP